LPVCFIMAQETLSWQREDYHGETRDAIVAAREAL